MPDETDKLQLLAAALFAVRLFRADPENFDPNSIKDPGQRAAWDAAETRDRQLAAERSALDAQAILKAAAAL